MSGEFSFEGRGLPREDELLARVIVDLGLARQGDVLNAVEVVRRLRAESGAGSLAQTLQDNGSLHPRFVAVVMKAVNNKLVAEGLPPAPVPKPPARRTSKRLTARLRESGRHSAPVAPAEPIAPSTPAVPAPPTTPATPASAATPPAPPAPAAPPPRETASPFPAAPPLQATSAPASGPLAPQVPPQAPQQILPQIPSQTSPQAQPPLSAAPPPAPALRPAAKSPKELREKMRRELREEMLAEQAAAAPAQPSAPIPGATSPPTSPPTPPPTPDPTPDPTPAPRFAPTSEDPPQEGPDIVMPEGIFFKDAPKGEGFSRRSKTEIASAWAARKAGTAPGQAPPSVPSRKKVFTAAERMARIGNDPPPAQPSTEDTLPGSSPSNPLAALVSPRKPGLAGQAPPVDPLAGMSDAAKLGPPPGLPPGPSPDTGRGRRAPVDPRVGLGRPAEDKPVREPRRKKPPVNSLAALVSPKQRRGEPKGPPKKRYKKKSPKFASSGATQSINLEDLRAELGFGAESDASEGLQVTSEEQRKTIELHAFVKRAVRSMLHQQCLDVILRKRLSLISAARLAKEVACRERDARRVLDDWKMAGIALVDADALDPEYQFAPSKADLATIREFMVSWNDGDWHNKLLGWIIEEEHK